MPVIDVHTHGVGGYDTRSAGPDDIIRIAEIHGSYGINAIIPTIYSSSIERMRADIAAVKRAMEVQRPRLKGETTLAKRRWQNTGGPSFKGTGESSQAEILGVHLEGPFLNPARAGALDLDSFLPAETVLYEELIEGFRDIVKIVTVAPEIEHAPRLIKRMADMGAIVSMGHSDATYAQAEAGFHAGARGLTHIFNAMRGIHHREPGIAGFGLTNPHVYVEIVADPFHLHAKTIELIFSAKTREKIIIVSDSVKQAKTGAAAWGATDPTGRLLGGSMTVTESVRYLMGLGLAEDMLERCVSVNPEAYLDLAAPTVIIR